MAELKGGVKWLLFLSSYIPLYAILIFQHWSITVTIPETTLPIIHQVSGESVPIVSAVWILLGVISFIALYLVLSLRRSRGGQDFKNIDSYKSRDELVTTYILVYIFPFVVLDYSSLINWMAFLIFFLVIGIIQVRSTHLHVNPILAILGYRIYEVDTGERKVLLVTKKDIQEPVDSVRTVELSNDVHMTV